MRKQINLLIIFLVTIMGFGVCATEYKNDTSIISAVTSAPPSKTKPVLTTEQQTKNPQADSTAQMTGLTSPIAVVKNPSAYLNKKVTIAARFDKFSTLGLDYKPALRSSETYISFLIMRNDTDKNIPLSEMKIFMKRSLAEKFVDLKEGDKVKFTGTVFSTALGDPWLDVDCFEKVK